MPSCTHLEAQPLTVVDFAAECEDCIAVGGSLDSSAPLFDVRPHRLLRLLAQQARHGSRARHRTSGRHLRRTRGELALVLRRPSRGMRDDDAGPSTGSGREDSTGCARTRRQGASGRSC